MVRVEYPNAPASYAVAHAVEVLGYSTRFSIHAPDVRVRAAAALSAAGPVFFGASLAGPPFVQAAGAHSAARAMIISVRCGFMLYSY
jgi:hypothetical protein